MAKSGMLTKRLAINKANTQIVAVVAVTSFVTVFCLVASQAVLSQDNYQSRVTAADEKAHQQLQQNIQDYSKLAASYESFVAGSTNVIGGSTTGSASNDGDNAKIILDALPGAYDFPALTVSLDNILSSGGFTINSITGTDDQVNQQNNVASANPQPVSIPFSFSISHASYAAVGALITQLQNSIRPIQIDSISLNGAAADMTLTVDAHTYYQPAKSLSITKQVVK